MIRPIYAVTVVAIVAAIAASSSAQPSPEAPNSQAALEEAKQLNQMVVRLYGEGKFREALPPAERALALRRKALGPTHPDVVESLNNVALLYQAQGEYAKAEPLLVRALYIREKVLGPAHPLVATSLNNLATLYRAQGAYAKAEPLYTHALDISEKALGPTHPEVAQSLNNLALLYQDEGAYAKAEPLYTRALDISEKAFGPAHSEVSTSLNNLAALYRTQGAYAKAEPLYLRALDIAEKALGPTHPNVATSLSNLATLYTDQRAYRRAEPLLVRALNIEEKALGPSHPDAAVTLNKLATLYRVQGTYDKAEPLLVRALDIFEKTLGPTHAEVATSLNNLARLYLEQGAYGKAELLLTRALGIREKALGPNHPAVARNLNELAVVYRDEGAYHKAELLLVRARDICEKTLGPSHPDTVTTLNNLARLYSAQNEYDKAESLFVQVLGIREKAMGPSHPEVAKGIVNLAELYEDKGEYSKAEPLLIRALDIFEKALGLSHLDVATSLNDLATLYRAQGAYNKAEALVVRALGIREKTLDSVHSEVANTLNNLATLYWAKGAYQEAQLLLARAAEIQEHQLRSEFALLSEPRRRALMTLLKGDTDIVVSFHAHAMPGSTSAFELALTTMLRRKGRLLDSLVEAQTKLRSHLTPRVQGLFDQLSEARSDLVAQLYTPAGLSSAADRDVVAAIRVRIGDMESALSAASDDLRPQVEPVTLAQIERALPASTALVEFVRYRRFDARARHPWQEDRYLAYLLTQHGPPQWVALGEAAPIDAEVDVALAAMDSKVSAETTRAALQRLDAQVFAPIRTRLPGVSHLILAPDDKLNLVPFEALVDSKGHYAFENYLVSYVTAGRDLLRLAPPQQPRSSAVIVAGPDYGPLPAPHARVAISFVPLAGAAAEATDLRGYFPTAPVTGGNATKAALAALTGPAILHIATHGFYARSPGATTTGSARVANCEALRGMFMDCGAPPLPPPYAVDPSDALDRSGLAMAGANQSARGIVTAREIAGFDWWGTQLVVLSACETGVGVVASGDGVYGLRRALVLAGAASQAVSLWSVSDASTRALMRDYYGELAHGTGRAEALRQAKLRLMRQARYAHPYYWAAFIPAGDWRPLDKTVFLPRKSQP
jgi:CHAT domain-containing protein/tetratricopeptide (TPR) repeat protein